jgi:UTP--glucose-1-phosphate uridylyltransferase
MRIKKIVIPVAGYGTRFLPFTKSIPKEMLPVVDKPVIQYIVEDAVAAGIEEVILVTGYSKRAIEDYFDYNIELEYLLEKKGKQAEKKLIRDISDIAKFIYVRQKEQLGTGHALLQVRELINDEPFMFIAGDDLYHGNPLNLLRQTYEKYEAPVLLSMKRSAPDDYSRYGYLKLGEELEDGVHTVTGLVEKPNQADAPSDRASFSCYILNQDIFSILENQPATQSGEIWLSEAISTLSTQQKVVAVNGDNLKYFDCGNKLEYMKAAVEFSLEREDISDNFREYLKGLSL